MNRLFLLFCLLMLAGCEQETYWFYVSFRNVCAYPVHITAYRNSNVFPSDEILDRYLLESNDSVTVFHRVEWSDEIHVPDDYKLEISVNGKTISLDKAQFLEVLKKSDYSREKGACIICTSNRFSGTISTPSLCPVAEENAENLQ
ncbi:MAG: hypothetical protein LBQ75_02785 [Zoogloeaceae bacterium]|nr:hypothetical protein [Zoogloeaceae bacterium]